MGRKPNLAEIASAGGSTRRQALVPRLAPVEQPDPNPPALITRSRAPSRSGTKQVAAHFPEEVAWQLRELAVEQRGTVQDLLGEALNDLFQKYGKPELLAPRRKA